MKKGTATEADKKACCQNENNSIWTTNEVWAGTCCTLTDDNGYYLYRRDNSKAAMCCSAWVDSQMIKYNPSEYNSSDGKSGGCPRFDKTCIYQNFSGSVEACTLSCSTNGSPNKEYVNKYCCNEWKSGSKLQQGTELFNQCCSLLQNDDNVWKDFCTPQEQTCPPISEANADNASAKCCSEWMPPLPNGGIRPINNNEAVLGACCKNDEWVQVDRLQKGFCCPISGHSSYAPCGGGGGGGSTSNSCNNKITIRCGAFRKNGNEYIPTTGQYGVIGCLITQTDTNCYPKISDVSVILHQGSSNVNHSLPIGVGYAFQQTGDFVYGMYNGEKCIFSFSGSSSGNSVNMTQQQEAPPLYGCDYSYVGSK